MTEVIRDGLVYDAETGLLLRGTLRDCGCESPYVCDAHGRRWESPCGCYKTRDGIVHLCDGCK